jgi:hypothetical protein
MAEAAAARPILHKLDTRPKASDLYLWCDYVEVRCLTHPDHKYSRGSLLELLDEGADVAIPLEGIVEDEDELDDQGDPIPEEIPFAAVEENTEELPVADRNEAKVADIFKNLQYRAMAFGAAYPFALDEAAQELSLLDIAPSERKLYLQLLLSASLRLVPKQRRHELTKPFESVSERIFSCLMPAGWEVYQFGAANSQRYQGHLFDRLSRLAKDIRGQLHLERRHFKTTNAGDGGLDLVAWHPLGTGDIRPGIPIALAQCGCTAEEWSLKSLEASPSKLGAHLHTLHPWATYYFMPQDLIEVVGATQDWQRRNDLTRSIVIDRRRLVKLAEQYNVAAQCATAIDQIEEARQLAVV